MNSSPSPVRSAGTGMTSSTFSWASTSVPAATSPTRGTWRTGRRSTAAPEVGVAADLDGAGLGGVAPEVAEPLERGEVGVHGGGRAEADALADLADRRGVAPLAHGRVDALEDLALAGGEGLLGHGGLPGRVRPGGANRWSIARYHRTRVGQTPVRRHNDRCSWSARGERPFETA